MKKNILSVNHNLVAILIAFSGVMNVMSAWLIHHPARAAFLEQLLSMIVIRGSWLTAVVAGSMQLFIAFGLSKRKIQAWRITVIILCILFITSLLHGLHYVQSAVNMLLLLLLIALKPQFRAASDPPSITNGIFVFFSTLVFVFLYGLFGFYLLDRHFHEHFNLFESSRQSLLFLLWIGEPPGHHLTHIARWFLDSFDVIEIIGLVYGVSMILRPVIYRRSILPHERKRALDILIKFGHSSLAYLTLLPDKLYFFSNSGRSYAAYALVGNVAIVLGDPIGPKDDLNQLVSQFKETCFNNDWHPVFYQVLPENLSTYHNLGFKSLKIGEEAIIDLKKFSMEGSQRKSIRQSVNRLSRKGFKIKIIEPPLDDLTLKQLKEVSDEWLHLQHGSEKRFSLGWFDVQYLKKCIIIAVSDAQDNIVAFANLIPEYNRNEGTIDLMRRRDKESGIMDFLFVRLIEFFREQGYQSFNLGLSPLAGVGTKPEDSFQEKFLNFFYDHFNQLYSFKGLHFFKDKFDPFWEPRYLIYLKPILLPKIGIAIITANAGGNLLKTYLAAWWDKKRSAG